MQQYHDHNESFYKVYVIDEEVMIFRRPSLPNLLLDRYHRQQQSNADMIAPVASAASVSLFEPSSPVSSCTSSKKRKMIHSLAFDSRYSYPTIEDFTRCNNSIDNSNVSKEDDTSHSSNTSVSTLPLNRGNNELIISLPDSPTKSKQWHKQVLPPTHQTLTTMLPNISKSIPITQSTNLLSSSNDSKSITTLNSIFKHSLVLSQPVSPVSAEYQGKLILCTRLFIWMISFYSVDDRCFFGHGSSIKK
jgi:hypothetical protein